VDERVHATVLLVADDSDLPQRVTDWLTPRVRLLAADSLSGARAICAAQPVDALILCGDEKRLGDWLDDAAAREGPRVLFVTEQPSYAVAVCALRAGAVDCLSQPIDRDELVAAVDRALSLGEQRQSADIRCYESAQQRQGTVLVGDSPAMGNVKRLIDLAASVHAPVLITGETGSGKNVVAAAIHYRSRVRHEVLLGINCGALAPSLIESELFGYDKGAFTGAVQTHRGIFEMASGGTLFLDEIAELPSHLQAKLLGVLEEQRVRRLGGSAIIPVDVRLIAATCADVDRGAAAALRRDLYFRLSVVRIHLPPLRDRRQDIPALCEHFLGTLVSGRRLHIPDAELERMVAYEWPGNVRELRNVMERACIVQAGPQLYPSRLLELGEVPEQIAIPGMAGERIPTLKEIEREHIRAVFQRCGANKMRTARTLDVSLSTLKRKLKHYGLS
jgi:DNA-binding NtrC family response regulator